MMIVMKRIEENTKKPPLAHAVPVENEIWLQPGTKDESLQILGTNSLYYAVGFDHSSRRRSEVFLRRNYLSWTYGTAYSVWYLVIDSKARLGSSRDTNTVPYSSIMSKVLRLLRGHGLTPSVTALETWNWLMADNPLMGSTIS